MVEASYEKVSAKCHGGGVWVMGKSLSDALKKAGLEVNSTESQDVAREPLTLAIKLSYLKHYSSEISRVLTKLQSINNDAQEELDTLSL